MNSVGLGAVVVLHVGVEVEVVAAEVGEDRDVEDHAVDAAHHQRVAGHLHRAHVDAALDHQREQPVQVGRLRRGQRGLHVLPEDAGPDRPDDGARDARRQQPALEEPGGRGLALRAGDADHPQLLGRAAVDLGRDPAQDLARLLARRRRAARRRAVVATLRVGEDGDGAGGRSVGDVGDPVGARARERGVQVSGPDALRAQGDPADDGAGVTDDLRAAGQAPSPASARSVRGGCAGRTVASRCSGTIATLLRASGVTRHWGDPTRRGGRRAWCPSGGRRSAAVRSP